jgi:hypothetical protein
MSAAADAAQAAAAAGAPVEETVDISAVADGDGEDISMEDVLGTPARKQPTGTKEAAADPVEIEHQTF